MNAIFFICSEQFLDCHAENVNKILQMIIIFTGIKSMPICIYHQLVRHYIIYEMQLFLDCFF